MAEEKQINLGTRSRQIISPPRFPDAGAAVQERIIQRERPEGAVQARMTQRERPEGAVDVLLVNPPAPDGGIWIRSQHRVGRKSRENMIWPQVSLAQMAAVSTGGAAGVLAKVRVPRVGAAAGADPDLFEGVQQLGWDQERAGYWVTAFKLDQEDGVGEGLLIASVLKLYGITDSG
jgi:hypothetical protein